MVITKLSGITPEGPATLYRGKICCWRSREDGGGCRTSARGPSCRAEGGCGLKD